MKLFRAMTRGAVEDADLRALFKFIDVDHSNTVERSELRCALALNDGTRMPLTQHVSALLDVHKQRLTDAQMDAILGGEGVQSVDFATFCRAMRLYTDLLPKLRFMLVSCHSLLVLTVVRSCCRTDAHIAFSSYAEGRVRSMLLLCCCMVHHRIPTNTHRLVLRLRQREGHNMWQAGGGKVRLLKSFFCFHWRPVGIDSWLFQPKRLDLFCGHSFDSRAVCRRGLLDHVSSGDLLRDEVVVTTRCVTFTRTSSQHSTHHELKTFSGQKRL
jgi:hypothetical protein